MVGEPFMVDPYGIGVTKDDPSAKGFVNAWLKTIQGDGSWAAPWKATIGTVVEVMHRRHRPSGPCPVLTVGR